MAMFKPLIKLASCCVLIMLGTNKVAQAGEWKYTIEMIGESATYTKRPYTPPGVLAQPVTEKFPWDTDPNQLYETIPYYSGPAFDEYVQGWGSLSVRALMRGTVRKTLKWFPENQNDLPPKVVYVYEYSASSTLVRQGNNFGPTYSLPDAPHEFTVDNGFGTPAEFVVNSDWMKQAFGWKLVEINNSERRDTIPLDSYYISNSARIDNEDPLNTHSYLAQVSYLTKLSHATLYLFLRRPGTETLSLSLTTAAGAKDSPEHYVEVVLRAGAGTSGPAPLLGQTISAKPRIYFANGVEADALFEPAENPVFDASGFIVLGRIRSSDKLSQYNQQTDRRLKVVFDVGLGDSNPTAYINQTLEGTWAMGENGELPWSANVEPGESFPVTYKLRTDLTSDIPVTGHTLNFSVARLKVNEWEDETEQNVVERIYLLDDPELELPDEPGAIRKSAEFMSAYVQLGGAVQATQNVGEASPGNYKTTVLIPQSDDWTVSEFQLGVKDLDAYIK